MGHINCLDISTNKLAMYNVFREFSILCSHMQVGPISISFTEDIYKEFNCQGLSVFYNAKLEVCQASYISLVILRFIICYRQWPGTTETTIRTRQSKSGPKSTNSSPFPNSTKHTLPPNSKLTWKHHECIVLKSESQDVRVHYVSYPYPIFCGMTAVT